MQLTFEPSFASVPQCDDILIIPDNILENTENFQVLLSTTDTAVAIDPNRATVSIFDNDSKYIKSNI